MTPSTDRALRLENAELLRALATSMESVQQTQTAIQGKQDAMQIQVSDIRDKVISIEARDHGSLIAALTARITVLETDMNKRDGATGVIAAVMKSPLAGWLALAVASIWAVATARLEL